MTIPEPLPGRVPLIPPALEARFQRVYEENQHLVFRYVYNRLGNREDAEDLTADVFLKAAASLDYGRSPAVIRQWLFTIAQHTLIDHWRARDRGVTASSLEELLASGECTAAADEPSFRQPTRHHELQRLLCARLAVDPWPERTPADAGSDQAEPAGDEERAAERVAHLLERLPVRYREVLTCRFLRGLTIRETALHLGLSEANVKVTQLRALKRAAELEQAGPDD